MSSSAAEEVAAREDGRGNLGARNPFEDEEAVEELLLDTPDAEVGLGERGPEDQDDPKGEQHDGELQRDEEIAELPGELVHGWAGRTVCRNARKAGLAGVTRASGPISLKNQVPPRNGTMAPRMRCGLAAEPLAQSTIASCRPLLAEADDGCRQVRVRDWRKLHLAPPAVHVGQFAADVAGEGGDREIAVGAAGARNDVGGLAHRVRGSDLPAGGGGPGESGSLGGGHGCARPSCRRRASLRVPGGA